MHPTDDCTTVKTLKKMVHQFREERDWTKYSDLKDLSANLAIEAAELMELFLWKTSEEINNRFKSDKLYAERIKEELADVVISALAIALTTNTDLSATVKDKLAKICAKYPIDQVKGKAIDKGMAG